MSRDTQRRLSFALVLLPLWLGTSSCLIGRSENTKFSGRYIPEDKLQQIEEGDSQDDVTLLLGPPSSKTEKSTGATVWKYAYNKATTKSGAVFLLFGSSSTVETEGAVYVEFDQQEKVVKTWSER
ncbi:MAG: outer membrane protein assembly factor BamE [Planctomycetota bacterium]